MKKQRHRVLRFKSGAYLGPDPQSEVGVGCLASRVRAKAIRPMLLRMTSLYEWMADKWELCQNQFPPTVGQAPSAKEKYFLQWTRNCARIADLCRTT